MSHDTAGVRLLDLPIHRDERGALTFAQVPEHLPFIPLRYFLLFDLQAGVARGAHAHRVHEQFLLCVHGRCRVTVDDGRSLQEFSLETPSQGLYVPAMTWTTVYPGSADTVVLVLTSAPYDATDYIRDRSEFERAIR